MKWLIVSAKNSPTLFRAIINPINEALSGSLDTIKLENYPEFIIDISNSCSTGYEWVSLRFFNDIYWEDLDLAEDMVGRKFIEGEVFVLHRAIGATILEEALFDKILYDYAKALLDYYGDLPENQEQYTRYWDWYKPQNPVYIDHPNWKEAMTFALNKLKTKIIQRP